MLLSFSFNISKGISFSGLNCLLMYAQCGNVHIPRAYVNATSCLALHKIGVEYQRTLIYAGEASLLMSKFFGSTEHVRMLQGHICEVMVSLHTVTQSSRGKVLVLNRFPSSFTTYNDHQICHQICDPQVLQHLMTTKYVDHPFTA